MRWFFLLLIFANALAWFWFSATAEQRSKEAANEAFLPGLADAPAASLMLLSELDEPQGKAGSSLLENVSVREEIPAAESGLFDDVAVVQGEADSEVLVGGESPVEGDAEAVVEVPVVDEALVASEPQGERIAEDGAVVENIPVVGDISVVDDTPVFDSSPVVDSAPAVAGAIVEVKPVPDTVLAAGGEGVSERAIVELAVDDGPVDAAEAAADVCSLLGPFPTESVVAGIGARLSGLGVGSEVVSREVIAREVFWLTLPPQQQRAGAVALLAELKSHKIDSFLIDDGEFIGSVSLGVFGSRENAESYRAELVAKGYQPVVNPLPRFQEQYWLSLLTSRLAVLSEEFWADIRPQAVAPELVVEEGVCPSLGVSLDS